MVDSIGGTFWNTETTVDAFHRVNPVSSGQLQSPRHISGQSVVIRFGFLAYRCLQDAGCSSRLAISSVVMVSDRSPWNQGHPEPGSQASTSSQTVLPVSRTHQIHE